MKLSTLPAPTEETKPYAPCSGIIGDPKDPGYLTTLVEYYGTDLDRSDLEIAPCTIKLSAIEYKNGEIENLCPIGEYEFNNMGEMWEYSCIPLVRFTEASTWMYHQTAIKAAKSELTLLSDADARYQWAETHYDEFERDVDVMEGAAV